MRSLSRRLGIIVSASLLVLSACTKGKDGATATGSVPGGVFFRNLGAEPPSLNVIDPPDLSAQNIQGLIQEGLLTRNVDTYAWEPALAESWEISKDGKVFTFKIRSNAKFHDGKPVTVEDVKFSFDAIFNDKYKAASVRSFYERLEKVEIVDASTIKIYAKDSYWGNFDVAAGLTVVPKHIYETLIDDSAAYSKSVVGTGPYKLGSWDRGKRITLVRNDEWYGKDLPHNAGQNNVGQVVFRFVQDPNIALEMLKKGDLDFLDIRTITQQTFVEKMVGPEWGKSVHKIKTTNKAPKSYGFIGWNFKNERFKDRDVRVALAHLMNRRLMIEKFRYGMSLPATGPLYQQSDYASPDVKPLEFDPKKASEILAKDGWKDADKNGILEKTIGGKKVELKFSILTANQDTMKYLTMYKEDAKQVGVEIEPKYLEWNSFIKLVDERNFDAVAMGWGGGAIDWEPNQIWHSKSEANQGSNFISYSNKEVDRLIDESRNVMDKSKRLPMLRKVYELIANDAPYLFLFNDKDVIYAHTDKMKKDKESYVYSIGTEFWKAAP